jgi:solute carrier family 26 protein
VALKGMLMQAKDLPSFWRLSKLDGLVWIITFLTVVLVDIDDGLLVGLGLSLASILVQGMKPYTCLLGAMPNMDLYLDCSRYREVSALIIHDNIATKVIKITLQLIDLNLMRFKSS